MESHRRSITVDGRWWWARTERPGVWRPSAVLSAYFAVMCCLTEARGRTRPQDEPEADTANHSTNQK
eukprot:6644134-Prymnesium_polylepis.1